MPRAVKFDRYGGIDVMRVVEVDRPVPKPKKVLPPALGRLQTESWTHGYCPESIISTRSILVIGTGVFPGIAS